MWLLGLLSCTTAFTYLRRWEQVRQPGEWLAYSSVWMPIGASHGEVGPEVNTPPYRMVYGPNDKHMRCSRLGVGLLARLRLSISPRKTLSAENESLLRWQGLMHRQH